MKKLCFSRTVSALSLLAILLFAGREVHANRQGLTWEKPAVRYPLGGKDDASTTESFRMEANTAAEVRIRGLSFLRVRVVEGGN